jgi:hypothetical protein
MIIKIPPLSYLELRWQPRSKYLYVAATLGIANSPHKKYTVHIGYIIQYRSGLTRGRAITSTCIDRYRYKERSVQHLLGAKFLQF